MKNIVLILFVVLVSFKSFSQTQDSLLIKEDSSLTNYLYRVKFDDNFVKQTLIETMTEMFKTKIEYNKDLNQYIFVTNEDIDQSELSKNLAQQVTFFRKVLVKTNL